MSTRIPTVTTLCPSIENCDPLAVHRRATPHAFALPERPILYGGGRRWLLRCSDPSCLRLFPLNHSQPLEVDVFVLSSGVVIWFDACSRGIDIPYASLGAHAVRNDVDRLMLHLQVSAVGALEGDCYAQEAGYDATVVFEVVPMYKEDERYYNDEIDKLFTYDHFGLNKGSKMAMNTFHAIAECSAMCLSDEEEVEAEEYTLRDVGGVDSLYDDGYDNTGDADDMDLNESFEDGGHSAVDVVFYDEEGRRRTREEMESSPRGPQAKRVRC